MAGCCNPRGCDQFFNARFARRTAERYRKRGLDKTARQMVAWARKYGLQSTIHTGGPSIPGSSLIDKDIVLAADADVIVEDGIADFAETVDAHIVADDGF